MEIRGEQFHELENFYDGGKGNMVIAVYSFGFLLREGNVSVLLSPKYQPLTFVEDSGNSGLH
jgi:hypothetical protein